MKKRLAFRYLLPLSLISIAMIQSLLILVLDRFFTNSQIQKNLINTSRNQLTMLVSEISSNDKTLNLVSHKALLSVFSSLPYINRLLIINDKGNIEYSYPVDLDSMVIADRIEYFDKKCNMKLSYEYVIEGNKFYAAEPFRTGTKAGKLGSPEFSLILIEYDMKNYGSLIHENNFNNTLIILVVMILFTIFVIIYFHQKVTLRIDKMVTDISHIGKGEYNKKLEIIGNDEISSVSNAVNQLTKNILDNQQKLMDSKKELVHSEENLRRILDNIELLATDLDEEGNIKYLNPYILKLTKNEGKNLIGLNWMQNFIPSEEREKIVKYFSDLKNNSSEISFIFENKILCSNGDKRSIRWRNTVIRGQDGKIKHIASIGEDITDKLIEAELEVREERLKSLGQLAGGIAHDFNNLLGMIFGFVDLALEKSNEEGYIKIVPYLQKAMLPFKRANALTSQLLTFSMGGAPIRSNARLDQIIKETVNFTLSGSSISVEYVFPSEIPLVKLDDNQIAQVFENLTINAKDAIEEGGKIKISLSIKNNNFILNFEDNGCGIDQEKKRKIFDPFYTTKSFGHGLGLSTVHSIITKHNGTISVESTKGVGTKFNIVLPIVASDSTDNEILEKSDPQNETITRNILILDDEDLNLEFLKEAFVKNGFNVSVAQSSKKIIKLYEESIVQHKPYNIVLLDLTIPGEEGGRKTALELLKLDPSAEIYVTSGYSDDPVMANPQAFGFKGSLKKPFNMSSIAEFIKNLSFSS